MFDFNFTLLPLHSAVFEGDKKTVKYLVKEGADINQKASGSGWTPLHLAVFRQNKSMAKLFLKRKAKTNISLAPYDLTPLHISIVNGSLEIATLLIRYGADVNYKSKCNNKTPLYVAVELNNTYMVKLLLSKGASIDYSARKGRSLFHLVDKVNNEDIIVAIIAHHKKSKRANKIKTLRDRILQKLLLDSIDRRYYK